MPPSAKSPSTNTTPQYGFIAEHWIDRSCSLYAANARIENTTWQVYNREIWMDDMAESIADLDFAEVARECMSEAFQVLGDEAKARSTASEKV